MLKAVDERQRRIAPRARRASTRRPGDGRRARCSSSTARRTSRSSAPTRSSASRWRSRAPRPRRAACRSTATSAAPTRACCRCRCMNVLNGGAHADNGARLPGVHDRARSARRRSPRRCARAPRFPRAEEACCTSRGCRRRVGDEGGFAPASGRRTRRVELIVEAIEKAGLQAGRGLRARARPRRERVLRRRAAYVARRARAERSRATRWSTLYEELVRRRIPIVSIEDGLAEDDWDGWSALTDALGDAGAARRRRPLRAPTPSDLARGIAGRHRQRDPDQGQPDRHADRDARGDARWPQRPATRGHLAPLGRDRGHVHRRPRGGDGRRADQDRRAGAHASGSRSTTSCCAIEEELGARARYASPFRRPNAGASGDARRPTTGEHFRSESCYAQRMRR